MSARLRLILMAAGGFAVAVVLATLTTRSLADTGEIPVAVLPAVTAEADPVVVPIAVDGDFAAAAADYAAAAAETGQATAGEGGSGSGGAAAVTDFEGDGDEGSAAGDPAAFGPPGATPPAGERAADLCADGGSDCPDGIGGTILLAIRAVPPLAGTATFAPDLPGGAAYIWSPECPPADPTSGVPVLGVSTNRPATISVRYLAGRWVGGGYEVDGTVEVTTPDAAEGPWNTWLADDTAADDDPRSWIHQCIALPSDLPPRTDYKAQIEYRDKYDPAITVRERYFPLPFTVLGPGGVVPGTQRRPTFLLGYGIDDLRIGVTRTPDQTVEAVAIAGGEPGVCDTGGDDRSVIDRPDAITGRVISDQPIAPEVLADPGYLWLPEYTESTVLRIGLQEGTDYRVCLYWVGSGPSFDRRVIDVAEEVVVGTPEAYRPQLFLHDLANVDGDIDQVSVRAPGCETQIVPLATDRTGSPDMAGGERELCTLETDLTEYDRGIRLTTAVRHVDGTFASNRPFVRTDLECDGPCLIRFDELALVPLPPVPGDEGSRSAGDAIVRIVYRDVPGNGLARWSIAEAAEFEDTPPALPEIPQLDVDVSYVLAGSSPDPALGARAMVTVTADRPVTLTAAIGDTTPAGDAACRFRRYPTADSAELAMVHTVTLGRLCLGSEYQLTVSAVDDAGTPAVIVDRFGVYPGTIPISVPPVWAVFDITGSYTAPAEGRFLTIGPIRVLPRTVEPPYGTDMGWILRPGTRTGNQAIGWVPYSTYDSVSACAPGVAASGPLLADASVRPGSLLGQEEILLRIEVIAQSLHPVGGIYGECARDELLETITLQATTTLADLRAGVTLSDDSGRVVITLQVVSWRSELIG